VKDGLVKDTKTGLMWMRCSLGQTWNGKTCEGKALGYTWDNAMKQADYANQEKREGYDDWRVPTYDELKTLVYCRSGLPKKMNDTNKKCDSDYAKPTIKSEVFLKTPSDWFWSSSPNADNSSDAWFVDFNNDNDYGDLKDNNNFVRLVR
jgi:hypothetical protein